jgi:hypothetical protein
VKEKVVEVELQLGGRSGYFGAPLPSLPTGTTGYA